MWAARLGHCGEWQLDAITKCATGLPKRFQCHPFRFVDFKEQAQIRHQAAGRTAQRVLLTGKSFFVKFGFIKASTSDFSRHDPKRDRVVSLFNRFSSYLLIVDEASRYTWVLLCRSKDPPIDKISAFHTEFGLSSGGTLRCNCGG